MRKKENYKSNKKLFSAFAMFLLSGAMLGTATYAWFTMNKEVSVTGMQVKAHAEEGLLINEVKTYNSPTWDDQATANTTPTLIALRPASTNNLTDWWHANSRYSYDEAGIENLSGTVDIDGSGTKYADVKAEATGMSDQAIVAAGEATGNLKAETHVYYKDASFGSGTGSYDDGEGFYVKYTYYLKSSGDTALNVENLQAQVKAVKVGNGQSDDLDPALRVGVQYGAPANMKIFSPIPGAASGSGATNTSYDVTTDSTGSSTDTVTPVVAATTGQFTDYTKFNTANVSIPNVNTDGSPVYVYVWFEGEDTHCMSDNLTTALASYEITINFKDADLESY